MTFVINFFMAFILSAALTPLVRIIATRKGWIAQPKSDRWHKKPTALMGGIAIFGALLLPILLFSDFKSTFVQFLRAEALIQTPSIAATICVGATFLFIVGLVDDLRNIKPHNKLIAQILAASLVVFLGFRLHWLTSLTLDTLATVFWIVGITNAFNLIDNMDGLCAGIGFVATASLAVLYYPTSSEYLIVAVILAGAMGGFLLYNINPAKIFMGDCGSLVIGFSISVLLLYGPHGVRESQLARIAIPVLVLLVPIMDTTLVTFIRLLSGRKASTGGRDHTSHRLVLMGFSEKNAVFFLYGIGVISGFAANFVSRSDTFTSPAVIIPVVVSVLLMSIYLSQLRVYPEKEFSALRDRSFTPILIEVTFKRQLIMVVLDLCLMAFCYYLAYRLRFEKKEFTFYFQVFLKSLPAVIACKMMVFYWMGVYRGLWGYLSTNDVFLHVRASLFGSLMAVAAVTFVFRFKDFSKAVFIIDWLLNTSLLLGVRGSFRLFLETQRRKTMSGDKVVIYGAGRGGELLLREILNNSKINIMPIGFVDDDDIKKGKKIQGYPILGTFREMTQIHEQHQLNGILVSFNDEDGKRQIAHSEALKFCKKHGLFIKKFKIDLQNMDINY